MNNARLGVDVGGTFTDFVFSDPASGRLQIGKILTTPAAPERAIVDGAAMLTKEFGAHGLASIRTVLHATTLVANALIERQGARTALITNAGFIDILDLGVESRYDLYDLAIRRPAPLVPRHLRYGISERMSAGGQPIRPVQADEVEAIAARLREADVETVAVCLLHSYRNPEPEQKVRQLLAGFAPDIAVTLSSDVAPEIRELPRSSTAVANAFVQPRVQGYLERLDHRLNEAGFQGDILLMLSEGGLADRAVAAAAPIRLVESGPAAGAIAAATVARQAGIRRAMAFDMGGTTAKLCLIADGSPMRTHMTEVARLRRFRRGSGLPLAIPSVELIEVGAGGGSIAWRDTSGLVRVGPESAQAVPGPACYGRGGERATVTDADLVLGRLDAARFFGGRMKLDRKAAETSLMNALAGPGIADAIEAARAVVEVVDEEMALAARIHAVEHGEDPSDYTLIAFGGAGPLHAWRIATSLRIRRVLVPPGAGVMSALGLLASAPAIELSATRPGLLEDSDLIAIGSVLTARAAEARATLARAGADPATVRTVRSMTCRYRGQAYEVAVELPDAELAKVGSASLIAAFEQRYNELYGRTLPGGAVEVVTWRVAASAPQLGAPALLRARTTTGPVEVGSRQVWFPGHGLVAAMVLDRYAMHPGDRFDGPAVVEEDETTTLVGPGTALHVDEWRNLVLVVPAAATPSCMEIKDRPSVANPVMEELR